MGPCGLPSSPESCIGSMRSSCSRLTRLKASKDERVEAIRSAIVQTYSVASSPCFALPLEWPLPSNPRLSELERTLGTPESSSLGVISSDSNGSSAVRDVDFGCTKRDGAARGVLGAVADTLGDSLFTPRVETLGVATASTASSACRAKLRAVRFCCMALPHSTSCSGSTSSMLVSAVGKTSRVMLGLLVRSALKSVSRKRCAR
jgi:hypothetical protein